MPPRDARGLSRDSPPDALLSSPAPRRLPAAAYPRGLRRHTARMGAQRLGLGELGVEQGMHGDSSGWWWMVGPPPVGRGVTRGARARTAGGAPAPSRIGG